MRWKNESEAWREVVILGGSKEGMHAKTTTQETRTTRDCDDSNAIARDGVQRVQNRMRRTPRRRIAGSTPDADAPLQWHATIDALAGTAVWIAAWLISL